jgi:hypothetical protein
MRLRVNVAELACNENYVQDFKRIAKGLFSLEAEANIQLEIVDIPKTYTEEKKICEWSCNSEFEWELKTASGLRPKKAGEEVTIIVSVTEPDKIFSAAANPKTWASQWKDAVSKYPGNTLTDVLTDVLEVYPLLGGNAVTLKECSRQYLAKDQFFENCLHHKEARVQMIQLDSSYSCEKNCAKGVCQFKDASLYEVDQVGVQ